MICKLPSSHIISNDSIICRHHIETNRNPILETPKIQFKGSMAQEYYYYYELFQNYKVILILIVINFLTLDFWDGKAGSIFDKVVFIEFIHVRKHYCGWGCWGIRKQTYPAPNNCLGWNTFLVQRRLVNMLTTLLCRVPATLWHDLLNEANDYNSSKLLTS